MPRKGEVKAKVLSVLEMTGGATVPAIAESAWLSSSTVKDAISRLLVERCIEKLSFRREDLNPQEYRSHEKGRAPKFFYRLKPAGLKKLEYFKEKGLV